MHKLEALEGQLARARTERHRLEDTLRAMSSRGASEAPPSPTAAKENALPSLPKLLARGGEQSPSVASAGALLAAAERPATAPESARRVTIPRVAHTPTKAGMSWAQHASFTANNVAGMRLREVASPGAPPS